MMDTPPRPEGEPPGIVFRPATAADQSVINAIIREVGINPMSLKWPNFWLAVDADSGVVAGTGQIKAHGDGSRELASIATRPAYRSRGIAQAMIRRLIAQHTAATRDPLYLTCVSSMGPFYEPFGFRVIPLGEMPPYFRRIKRFVNLLHRFSGGEVTLLVMRRESDHAGGA